MFEQRYNQFTNRHQRRRRRQRLVAALRCLGLLLFVALLLQGIVALFTSPRFAVTTVRVAGRTWIPEADIKWLAQVPPGSNILRLRTSRLRRQLERHPAVEHATVHRHLPGTLVVRIQERKPLLCLHGAKGIIYVDRWGHAFTGPPALAAGVPALYGLRPPRPGAVMQGARLECARRALEALRAEGLRPIALALDGEGRLKARLAGGTELRLGTAAEVRKQAWMARLALARLAPEHEIEYLDLSSTEVPVWKPHLAGPATLPVTSTQAP